MLFIEYSKYVQKYTEYIHQSSKVIFAQGQELLPLLVLVLVCWCHVWCVCCAGATSGVSAVLVPCLVRLLCWCHVWCVCCAGATSGASAGTGA